MAKQRIVINIYTHDDPPYTGIEGENKYRALEGFFEGLGFAVESIDYGDTGVTAPVQAA